MLYAQRPRRPAASPRQRQSAADESHGGGCGCSAGGVIRGGRRPRGRPGALRSRGAAARTASAACCDARPQSPPSSARRSAPRSTTSEEREALPDAAVARLARLRQPDRRRRSARGRDRARPRLGRRDRRPALRAARRPDRQGVRARHDRRDARPRPRATSARPGVENVEFLKGTIEDIPLPDDSVDVVISNCVINLSGDKPRVLREAARVLRPGGRFAVSDVVADADMDEATRARHAQWTGCIAGALTREEFDAQLARRGPERRRDPARRTACTSTPASAIVRARKLRDDRPRDDRSSTTPRRSTATGRTSQWSPFDDRPRRATASSGRELDDDRPGARALRAVVADGRRGADHDEVLRPRRRARQRGGGDVPRHPAGRRGAPHAVLRPLPGRGRRRPATIAAHVDRAREQVSPTPSGRSSTRRSSQAHERLVAAPGDLPRRSGSSRSTTWSSRAPSA